MVRPTPIDLNPVKLNYYPFVISLDKCSGNSNVLSSKTCAPKKTKVINVKVFNIITNKNEAKAIAEQTSCDCKYKFNSTICNSNQKWNNKTSKCEFKNYVKCKKDYSCNPSTCICENSKYLKSIADTSMTQCDETINVMDNVSTKKTNTIATNVTSIDSMNCHSKQVRDCYILYSVLLVAILLLIITIICYHYAKQMVLYKMENNELKKFY